ncbi:MAG: hypothetical protein ACTSRU_19160 [Candidatus Hodarchaeales archaeon]
MALSNPRLVFGIHSFAPYKLNDLSRTPYGIIKVLDNSSFAVNSELIELTGGSQKFPWGVEKGISTAELSLSFSQYDDFLFEIAYGKAPTANAAEADGSVTALTDGKGVVIDATTGIASVGVKSGSNADLKFSQYLVKVVSSTTVDVYASSDIDFGRGTDGEYQDDALKITASPITIPDSGAAVEIAGYGLELIGGSGTVNLETAGAVGDTAYFSVRPDNSGSMDVTIGGAADVAPEFGAYLYGQQRGNEQQIEIDVFRMQLSGLPLGFAKNEWSTAEVTAKAYYDSARDGVISFRTVKPV